MSLPRYPEYKDSGAPWIGNMPSSWNVLPLLAVARERRESNQGMKEDNLLSLSYGRIVRKDMTSNDGLLPESFETYQIVRPGDVVFRLTDLQNDKRSLRTATVEEVGIITSAYLAVEPTGVESRFLSYLLRAYDLSKVFYSMGGGLRQSMKYADVARLPVLAPPAQEQQAIASFLDRETAKIDVLIAEQEKLLALLAEKRQATISHAATRGLDPNAPLKDSGIPWLGEVPVHWEVKPLGSLTERVSYGFTNPMPATDEGPYLLTANDIGMGFIKYESARRTSRKAFDGLLTDKSRPKEGDVLITKDGTLGRVALFNGADACINQSVAFLRLDPLMTRPEFIALALAGAVYQERMKFDAGGTTIKHIYISRLVKMAMAIPPVGEQVEIACGLRLALGRIDGLVGAAEHAASILRERRSALITAAVTGQIDVRGAVEPEAA